MNPGDARRLLRDCVALRRELHRHPELSGREECTAERLRDRLRELEAGEVRTGVGGHGVLAVYGRNEGPTVVLRCDTDALPIAEETGVPWASDRPGVAHVCGHDGHMATLVAVAGLLRATPPAHGRVALLFQPAEETGEGARRVLEDPGFRELGPDLILATHNLPGRPHAEVVLREGIFALASVGAEILFDGVESHASEPENGRNPAEAVAAAIRALNELGDPDHLGTDGGLLTVTHARVGERTFGTSPGEGVVCATFRSPSERRMREFRESVSRIAARLAEVHGIAARAEWREPFPATRSDPLVVAHVAECARELGLSVAHEDEPFRWSEDFGHFTEHIPGALFGLGAGVDHPGLHHPEYDFPDDLVAVGAALLFRIAQRVTSKRIVENPLPTAAGR